MAVDCSAQGLATASQCFECQIPDGMHRPIQTYLLAVIANNLAGTSMDPSTLANLAKCFECGWGNNAAMDTYLLCQIVTALGG